MADKWNKKRGDWEFKYRNFDLVVGSKDFLANDVIFPWETNPHKVHPFLVHSEGFGAMVVWASNLQDALDELVDQGMLDKFLVEEKDLADYGPEEEGIARLGNAGEPFDIQLLDAIELSAEDFPVRLAVELADARAQGFKNLYEER
jgi:hypothetical protein